VRIAISAALVFAAGLACRKGGAPAVPDAGPLVLGAESVERVTAGTLWSGPRIAGGLQPREQARVRAQVGGDVSRVGAELGDRVKRGQVLAVIAAGGLAESRAAAAGALSAARREAEVADLAYQRIRQLRAAGAATQAELEAAKGHAASAGAQVSAARARLAQAQTQLGDATARAPIDGVVSERAVNVGDVVAPGAQLFTVIDPSTMRLSARVPSSALGELKVGAKAVFEIQGYPGRRFEGALEQISPAADPVTRELNVLVSIPNPDARLIAGLFAEGRVRARSAEGLSVPFSAVDLDAAEPSVARVRGGRVERVEVELGLEDEVDERVVVTRGLDEGDLVLKGPARTLAEGTPVVFEEPGGTALR